MIFLRKIEIILFVIFLFITLEPSDDLVIFLVCIFIYKRRQLFLTQIYFTNIFKLLHFL